MPLARSQRSVSRCSRTHSAGPRSGLAGTWVLNGQPGRVIDTPRQRSACATTSSAARHVAAWLSPSSANVALGAEPVTPNSHGVNTPPRRTTRQGAFGTSSASAGRGTSTSRSAGFWHGRVARGRGEAVGLPEHRERRAKRAAVGHAIGARLDPPLERHPRISPAGSRRSPNPPRAFDGPAARPSRRRVASPAGRLIAQHRRSRPSIAHSRPATRSRRAITTHSSPSSRDASVRTVSVRRASLPNATLRTSSTPWPAS